MPGITEEDRKRIARDDADQLRRAQQRGIPMPNSDGASRGAPSAFAQAATTDEGAAKVAEAFGGTADSFQNFGAQLGLGTNNVSSGSSYGFNPITRIRTLLEWVYRGTWIGGMAVDTIADDMTRAGIDLHSKLKPDQAEVMQTHMIQTGVWDGIGDTVRWARLYGGCIGVIMIAGQDPASPLDPSRVPEGGFLGILPLDRWMVEPSLDRAGLVDEMGPDFGNPKFYSVRNDAPALPSMKVHYSRCIRLVGIKMPYWQRIMENLWGISVIERLYDRMVAFDSATQGASQLVYKSYIRWMKIEGMREIVAAGGKKMQGLTSQVDFARKYQGIEGVTLLDMKDDTGAYQFSGFAGISDALLQFAQQISGALQIPLVRLLGQSPAGLNSTGESDLVTYYDGIKQLQERHLRVGMDKVLRCVAGSKKITLPDNFNFSFAPLWQLSHEKRGEVAERITGTVLAAEERGIITPRMAATELREQSHVTGVFTNITDGDIEKLPDEIQQAPTLEELEAGANGGTGEGDGQAGGDSPPGTPADKSKQMMNGAAKDGPNNVSNAGIAHLRAGGGGAACKNQRAHMVYARENFAGINEADRCVRCNAVLQKWDAMRQRKEQGTLDADIADVLPRGEVSGIPVLIETPAGLNRWAGQPALEYDYGYVPGIPSAEGVHEYMDAIIGNNNEASAAWVVDKFKLDGSFDEHKIMLGFDNPTQATAAYQSVYPNGGPAKITPAPLQHLKLWFKEGDVTRPYADQARPRLAS